MNIAVEPVYHVVIEFQYQRLMVEFQMLCPSPENLLIRMIYYDQKYIMELAWRRILRARKQP